MKKVKVALVGRPNVGKSSLFNCICKKRISIEHEEEGVTRDRIYGETDFFGQELELIDTGGIDQHSKKPFSEKIKAQALLAIEEADTIIFVVDVRSGLTTLDEEVAKILYASKKPITLAINKVDGPKDEMRIHEFFSLGFERVVSVSAMQKSQMAELLEEALKNVNVEEREEEIADTKVAIIGRANVGKSTLLNYLFQDERSIVSDIAGTTRDAIDAILELNGKKYQMIDTAGIRRKKSEKSVIEKFAFMRTKDAIERADICILVLDSREGITAEEKRMANMIEKEGKGCILLFNKWDLVKNFRMEHCLKAVREEAPFLQYCPTRFISAKTGRNLEGLFDEIDNVYQELQRRVSTGELNRFLEKAMHRVHPPMITGKRLRIYYITQVATPAKFVFFVNHSDLLTKTYQKYLINEFRKTFSFSGVPLHFKVNKKASKTVKERIHAKSHTHNA